MMEELWKDINGYEGLYQVSNWGRIRSVDRVVEYKDGRKRFFEGEILHHSCLTSSGYLQVKLSKNDKVKYCYVHRLVAEHFCHNPDNKPTVNHNDENKLNNHADNLCWMTQQENNTWNNLSFRRKYYFTNKRKESLKKVCERNKKPVSQYDKYGNYIATYSCAQDAIDKLGMKQASSIGNACRNPKKTAGGFYWKYCK